MGHLIKYEWKKQKTSRWIILGCLAFCLAAYMYGLLIDDVQTSGIALGSMIIAAMFVTMFVGIQGMITLNRDLKTKQSYMLFMVPKSIWEILGAKFISAFLQMLFVFALFTLSFIFCLLAGLARDGQLGQFLQLMSDLGKMIFGKIDNIKLLQVWILVFFLWIFMVTSGFLSIIISRTLFLRSKFSGLLSAGLFLAINFIMDKIYTLFNTLLISINEDLFKNSFGADCVFYLALCGLLFLASGWIADKKLSV